MTRHHGYRSKTRSVFRKKVRKRGLPGLSRFMIEFNAGDKIDIIADSSFQNRGLPHRRFQGKTGTIVAKRGRCYEVHVKDGNKMKTLLIGQEHFRMNKSYQMDKEQLLEA